MSAIKVPRLPVLLLLLLILIAISPSTTSTSSSSSSFNSKSSYGQPCSINDITGDECDTSAFLQCDTQSSSSLDNVEGKCVCGSSTTNTNTTTTSTRVKDMMFYNETISICVVFAEGSCHKNPNCILNSYCSIDSICKCDPGYRFHYGFCLKWHNQPCSKDSECHVGAHMKCRQVNEESHKNKTMCGCKPDTHVWSLEHDTCVGLFGTQCLQILDEKCGNNSFCNEDQTCECEESYSPTPEKKCLLNYGSQCDNNNNKSCNHYKNLKCSEESFKCECESPESMLYDPKDDKCYVKLGQSCQFKGRGKNGSQITSMDQYECIPNAECVFEKPSPPTCRCQDGHFKTDLGKCQKSFSNGSPSNSKVSKGNLITLVLMGLIMLFQF